MDRVIDKHRMGRFLVPDRLFSRTYEHNLQLHGRSIPLDFSGMFVVKAEYNYARQGIEYLAIGCQFDEIPCCDEPPLYKLTVDGNVPLFTREHDEKLGAVHVNSILKSEMDFIVALATGESELAAGFVGSTVESDKAIRAVAILRSEYLKATLR